MREKLFVPFHSQSSSTSLEWENRSPAAFQHFRMIHSQGSHVVRQHSFYRNTVPQYRTKLLKVHSKLRESPGVVYPLNSNRTQTCSLILVANLAQPDWIQVNCNENITGDVFCSMPNRNTTQPEEPDNPEVPFCAKTQFLMNGKCHSVRTTGVNSTFLHEKNRVNYLTVLEYFRVIFGGHLSPVRVATKPGSFQVKTFDIVRQKYRTTLHQNYERVFEIFTADMKIPFIGENLFACNDASKAYISSLGICDGTPQCHLDNPSDEHFCNCTEFCGDRRFLCKFVGDEHETIKTCSPLYFKDRNGRCLKHVQSYARNDVQSHFACDNGFKIPSQHVDDLFADCGLYGDDEPILRLLLTRERMFKCQGHHEIPCFPGHSKCFNISDICQFNLDEFSKLTPCRNGGHLQNCRTIECPAVMFKCPKLYCISHSLICDGKWDCPNGIDEASLCRNETRCENMLKCRFEKIICIHLGAVCDGTQNCPEGEDELLCELGSIKCPVQCHCLALAMFCGQGRITSFPNSPFELLHIANIQITTVEILGNLRSMTSLRLEQTQTVEICVLTWNILLEVLTIYHNSLRVLQGKCFVNNTKLRTISITYTLLSTIENHSFEKLKSLKKLNLSNNFITALSKQTFVLVNSLVVLSIQNNSLFSVEVNVFEGVSVHVIETDDCCLCCFVNSTCLVKRPWFSSCSELLPTKLLKITIIGICISIFVLNLFSIVLNAFSRRESKSYLLIVLYINSNNILWGTYLGFLWIANVIFLGHFLICEKLWRSGFTCFMAFSFALLFNLLSPCVLLVLSITRLQVVRSPFASKFRETNFVGKLLAGLLACCFAATISCALALRISNHAVPFSLCFPFVDPERKVFVLKMTTTVTSGLQTSAAVTIIWIHGLLVRQVRKSAKEVHGKPSYSEKYTNSDMIAQLVVMSTANVLCWIPTNTVYLTVLFLPSNWHSVNLMIWTVVSFASLTSVTNPAVFIFTALRSLSRSRMMKREMQQLQERRTSAVTEVLSLQIS